MSHVLWCNAPLFVRSGSRDIRNWEEGTVTDWFIDSIRSRHISLCRGISRRVGLHLVVVGIKESGFCLCVQKGAPEGLARVPLPVSRLGQYLKRHWRGGSGSGHGGGQETECLGLVGWDSARALGLPGGGGLGTAFGASST